MKGKKELLRQEAAKRLCDSWGVSAPEERALIEANATLKAFRKGGAIYGVGDRPTEMMFLVEGKVKIYKGGISGRNQIVRVIRPGGMFGYRAFLASEDYRTSAMAFEDSKVAFVPMEMVKKLMRTNFNVCEAIMKHLAVELGQSDDRTLNLTQKHTRGRLAEALLFLKRNYGLEADGCTLSIYLSREDLACMSNMTTSNAIRTLSAFATEHIVAIDGRKIKIIDNAELEKTARVG